MMEKSYLTLGPQQIYLAKDHKDQERAIQNEDNPLNPSQFHLLKFNPFRIMLPKSFENPPRTIFICANTIDDSEQPKMHSMPKIHSSSKIKFISDFNPTERGATSQNRIYLSTQTLSLLVENAADPKSSSKSQTHKHV